MRILHLLEPSAGDEAVLACRESLRIDSAQHEVWLIGGTQDKARAAALGVTAHNHLVAPGGVAEAAFRRLRRLGADRTAALPHIIQCWSVPMLGLARLAFGRRTVPRAACLLRTPIGADSALKDRRDGFALEDTTLLALDESIRDAWAPAASHDRGGILLRDNIRLLPADAAPFIRATPPDPAHRTALRAQLGIPERSFAVCLLADPPSAGNAMRFAFICGLLYVAGLPVTGLIRTGSAHARRAARYVAHHSRRWGLVECESLPSMLAASDAAMWDHAPTGEPGRTIESSGPVALATAAAMGVPTVCAPHPLVRRFFGEAAGDVATYNNEPRALAWSLRAIAERSEVRERLQRTLLARAADSAREDAFGQTLLNLWREVANVPIVRTGLPRPTALAGAPA